METGAVDRSHPRDLDRPRQVGQQRVNWRLGSTKPGVANAVTVPCPSGVTLPALLQSVHNLTAAPGCLLV